MDGLRCSSCLKCEFLEPVEPERNWRPPLVVVTVNCSDSVDLFMSEKSPLSIKSGGTSGWCTAGTSCSDDSDSDTPAVQPPARRLMRLSVESLLAGGRCGGLSRALGNL